MPVVAGASSSTQISHEETPMPVALETTSVAEAPALTSVEPTVREARTAEAEDTAMAAPAEAVTEPVASPSEAPTAEVTAEPPTAEESPAPHQPSPGEPEAIETTEAAPLAATPDTVEPAPATAGAAEAPEPQPEVREQLEATPEATAATGPASGEGDTAPASVAKPSAAPIDIGAALADVGLVMIETDGAKAPAHGNGETEAPAQPLGRRPRPAAVIPAEPLQQVETRK